ncbi:MAG: hypothetical protein GX466_08855 [Candidatus Cloacimonetes bacterium]|nr:hypothetical protein [Candidatus Cloacimonadota bacterium]
MSNATYAEFLRGQGFTPERIATMLHCPLIETQGLFAFRWVHPDTHQTGAWRRSKAEALLDWHGRKVTALMHT